MSLAERRRSSGQLENWVDCHALDTSLYKDDCPLSETAKSLKIKAVEEAVDAGNIPMVCEHARTSEGLVSTQLRRKVWPLLLQVDISELYSPDHLDINDLPPHRDEGQVMLDIRRLFTAMSHFHLDLDLVDNHSLYTTILSQAEIEAMRRRLFSLVVRVLRKYPFLNYYQGYHDVAAVVLTVFGHDEAAFRVLERLTVCHLRDFMVTDIALSINHLKLVACIVEAADATLFRLVRMASNLYHVTGGVYFDYKFLQALLAVLTLYSHDMVPTHVHMVWDFILSYRSVALSLYIYAAAMLHFKNTILSRLGANDLCSFVEVDADLVHTLLSPGNLLAGLTDSDLVQILVCARLLIETYPLETLPAAPDTYDVWFGEYNVHLVLQTTSVLRSSGFTGCAVADGADGVFSSDGANCFVGPNDNDGSSASGTDRIVGSVDNNVQDIVHDSHISVNPMTVSDVQALVMLQEEELRRESVHEAELFLRLFGEDSLATSVTSLDDSRTLLALSLSNITAASISLNNKLINSLSLIIRKLFSREESDGVSKDSGVSALQIRIAKISLTVGFVGFLVHFLLRHSGLSTIRHSDLGLRAIFDVKLLRREMASIGRDLAAGAAHVVADVANYVRDADVMGLDLTHVGLGTLRSSVYSFGT